MASITCFGDAALNGYIASDSYFSTNATSSLGNTARLIQTQNAFNPGTGLDASGQGQVIGEYRYGTNPPGSSDGRYIVFQGFDRFDTTLPASVSSIDSWGHQVYIFNNYSAGFDNAFSARCRVFDWGASRTVADWRERAAVVQLPLVGSFASTAVATTGYKSFTENGTNGRTRINMGGYTYYFYHSSSMEDASPALPKDSQFDGTAKTNYFSWRGAQNAGTSQDPFIVLDYTAPASSGGKPVRLRPSTSRKFGGSAVSGGGSAAGGTRTKSTGGNTVTDTGTHLIHTFTASGTFTLLENVTGDVLIVGGGAGGGGGISGGARGGGGGAGGMHNPENTAGMSGRALHAGVYSVVVGAGGIGANFSHAGQGGDSSFDNVTALGGGRGAGAGPSTSTAGGSGGGGMTGVGGASAGSAGQGSSGGAASGNDGGGGGGASAAGVAGNNAGGGAGRSSSISGSAVTYARGGNGGSGGGAGAAGAANTGNGGQGGGSTSGAGQASGAGGSGIVIIKVPK